MEEDIIALSRKEIKRLRIIHMVMVCFGGPKFSIMAIFLGK